ncbi:MAG: IS21-like element helper ATPase IstB [Planctomycetota bacterium]
MMPGASVDMEAALTRLRLPTIRRRYIDILDEAEKESWTYREMLERLVGEELANRAETRMQRAIRKARFPFVKTIEEFDFEFQGSIKKAMLGRFLGPELVSEGRNLVLLGEPGRGKTHLAVAMAYKAIQNGFDARCVTAAELLADLASGGSAKAIEARMVHYTRPAVLVIDELGYLSYAQDAANSLFQVIDRRYLAKKPVLITSNKDPITWGGVLHDPDLAAAIVDRLLERGEVIKLSGKSYRARFQLDPETLG